MAKAIVVLRLPAEKSSVSWDRLLCTNGQLQTNYITRFVMRLIYAKHLVRLGVVTSYSSLSR